MATSELDESIATAGAEERTDTLATAKKLRGAGIPAPHAEAITEAVRDEMKEFVPKSAIRRDLLDLEEHFEQRMSAMEERLESRMSAMEQRLEHRIVAMEERLEKNMAQMESRNLRFIATVMAGTLVAMTAIFTFILRGG